MKEDLVIAGRSISKRSRTLVEIPLPPLYTKSPLTLPVHVLRGAKSGPSLFVSAAIHGDELNGTEIVRRLLRQPALTRLRGTLIAIPIVNIYGLIHHARYLPDRRDLNRSFPGSMKGSLAARLAFLFMQEIVSNCTHGIDLHTGAIHRSNLPQIRANLDDEETARLANAFGTPVLLNANLRDGSLREAAARKGIPILLYEAGEALRFDEIAVRAGVRGILNVMRDLQMLPAARARKKKKKAPFVARSSTWIRSPVSGLFRKVSATGSRVKKGEVIGLVDDPFGGIENDVVATANGIIIGCAQIPLVHEGEALFHIARFEDVAGAEGHIESFQIEHDPEEISPRFDDEPPIV